MMAFLVLWTHDFENTVHKTMSSFFQTLEMFSPDFLGFPLDLDLWLNPCGGNIIQTYFYTQNFSSIEQF